VSVASFLYLYSEGVTNAYGDGVARLNMARKIVDHPDDSLWQRYVQLGTPWPPLHTLLMVPLVANDQMWRSGIAGSIISMVSLVLAAVGLYRLAGCFYGHESPQYRAVLPLVSVAILVLNPSALYLQSTPMTEVVFMAGLCWSVLLLTKWISDQKRRTLVGAGVVMALTTLIRYEAWPAAAAAVALVLLLARGSLRSKVKNAALYTVVTALGPAYWLWHNWAIYGSPVEFLTGPYSARGIYAQNRAGLGWSELLAGHPVLDTALLLTVVAVCVGPLVLLLGALGLARVIKGRWGALAEEAPVALLLVPFLFQLAGLYRGEIQVFPLSAFGLVNVRYGLPHLLPVALFAPAAAPLLSRLGARRAVISVCVLIAAQYGYLVSEGPSQLAIYQEGFRNGVMAKPARERARMCELLKQSPPRPTILMHTGLLGPLVSQGGLRFSDVIHEGTVRWHQLQAGIPDDVQTVIAMRGDPLDQKLTESERLAYELATEFEESLSVGPIRMLVRDGADTGVRLADRTRPQRPFDIVEPWPN
jgi:hypothetical protein